MFDYFHRSGDQIAGFLVGLAFAVCLITIGSELGHYYYQASQNPAADDLCYGPGRDRHSDICQQWRMANATERQVDLLDTQNFLMGLEVGAVWAALAVAILGACFAWKAIGVNRQEVRAYVGLSHSPPGLQKTDFGTHIRVQIKNTGKTPANVTSVKLKADIFDSDAAIPELPDYTNAVEKSSGMLHLSAGGKFFVGHMFSDINLDDLVVLDNDPPFQSALIVYGYVDYIDIFGIRHRSRYARRFVPIIGIENNLNLFTREGWNIDDRRRRGEGDDWV